MEFPFGYHSTVFSSYINEFYCINHMNDAKKHIIVIAHRGASAYEPENTLRSFKRAFELGADMIEFDVRLSRDRHLVIMHDEKVDRTTNGEGLVKDKTVSELKEPGTEEGVISLIKENNLIKHVFIVSFNQNLLKRVKDLESKVKTGLILLSSTDPIRLAKECQADAVAPFHDFITVDLIEKAHQNNLKIITWTVDNRGEAESLREAGIDGIVTNKPDIL